MQSDDELVMLLPHAEGCKASHITGRYINQGVFSVSIIHGRSAASTLQSAVLPWARRLLKLVALMSDEAEGKERPKR